MKKCPFCAEEIQDEAIKCKHCQSNLTQGNVNHSNQTKQKQTILSDYDKKQRTAKRNMGIFKIFLGCLLLFLNINRGGGFTSNSGAEATGYNITSFLIYILSLFLIVKGINGFRKENPKDRPHGKNTKETIISFVLLIVFLIGMIFLLGS